jgi:hypothetical protein
MAIPLQNIPAELNDEWLALRQKHQDESTDFQRVIVKKRAEFESRAEKARKALLAQHIKEEREFWSRIDGAHKGPPSATKTGQVQTSGTAKSNAAMSRTLAAPSRTPGSVTPLRALQASPHSTRSNPRRTQNKGVSVVINLCSDDEEDPTPTKRTATLHKAATTDTVCQQAIVQESVPQVSASSDQVRKSTSIVPEATIQFFGGNPVNYPVSAYYLIIALWKC